MRPARSPLLFCLLLLCAGCADEAAKDGGTPGGGEGPDAAPGSAPEGWDAGPGSGNVVGGSDGGVGPGGGPGGGPGAPPPPGVVPDMGAPGEEDPLDAPHDVFCAGQGPVVDLGDQEVVQATCTGQIAERIFTNALCTCENTRLAGYLKTRGFDSRDGAFDANQDVGGGAAVGMNGAYEIGAGFTDVGGSLSIAGAQALNFIGYLRTAGDLRLGGDVLVPGYVEVGRDAWLAGNLTSGPFRVGRDLHYAAQLFALPLLVDGASLGEPVQIRPPCPCQRLLDVEGIVDQTRAVNDNALVGLQPGALKQVVGRVEIELPCGRYYVDEISGIGGIDVRITGRVALMVGGPVAAAGRLDFDLAPDAELDLFIAGDLGLIGAASFGDRDRPAATRVYVGGSNDIVLIGASDFVGNVYAPRAKLTAPGYVAAYGSFFVKSIDFAGYANVVYDRAITDLDCPGEEDPPPDDHPGGGPGGGPDAGPGDVPGPDDGPPPGGGLGAPCSDACLDCADGLSCDGDRCRACRGDLDCCSQLICLGGECVPLAQ